MDNYEIPTTTIWGDPDQITVFEPGIVRFDTPGHGGVWLSPEQNAKVPLEVRESTFCQNGLDGWYEEDCDVFLLADIFPEHFGYLTLFM